MQVMPFDEAKNYRFNPFDLTKVWPHGDYPLIEVGRMTLDRNPTDYHTEIEQAAFQPNNLVPGIGPSPDKMLLGRLFAYADAHRSRIGANYQQLPVNAPQGAGQQLQQGRRDALPERVRPGVRAELQGRPEGRHRALRRRRPAWDTGGDMVRAATPCTRRTTTGARPARWSARYSTTPPASGWSTTSSGTCSTG